MTKRQGKSGTIDVKALLAEDEEFLRALVRTALQEVLEAEMTEALGAEKGERAAGRQGVNPDFGSAGMVQVIDRLEDAGGAEYIQFRPYRSLRDPNRILANWQHGVSQQDMASLGTSVLGAAVKDEYKRAYNEATQFGLPFLSVDGSRGAVSARRPANPAVTPRVAVETLEPGVSFPRP